ncbi:hypothetical protein MTR_4g122870 [Medicago truncatula]|uniref:Uncharacterized protein n=1 Tax=Medicago truncatula TaxID=3880 RepID=G7JPZ1_MEDTR|nr:hypothetical protein MTR_4g122870 [Medicago truncatula]
MVNVMKTKANTALNKIHKLSMSPPGQKEDAYIFCLAHESQLLPLQCLTHCYHEPHQNGGNK